MVPVEVLVNFGPLLQVLWVPVVRKVVLVHEVSQNGSTVCVLKEEVRICKWGEGGGGGCQLLLNYQCSRPM